MRCAEATAAPGVQIEETAEVGEAGQTKSVSVLGRVHSGAYFFCTWVRGPLPDLAKLPLVVTSFHGCAQVNGPTRLRILTIKVKLARGREMRPTHR